jgi:hypothetical protein
MVDEDGGILIPRLGELPLCLAIEARLSRLEVIDRDALPRLGGGEDRVLRPLFFTLLRDLCHGPK